MVVVAAVAVVVAVVGGLGCGLVPLWRQVGVVWLLLLRPWLGFPCGLGESWGISGGLPAGAWWLVVLGFIVLGFRCCHGKGSSRSQGRHDASLRCQRQLGTRDGDRGGAVCGVAGANARA